MAAAVGTLSLLLLCSVAFTSADGSQDCTHFAAIGQRYEVPLNFELRNNRMLLKHETKTLYDSKRPTKDTVTEKNNLILAKVTKEDKGTYTADIVDLQSGMTVKKITVNLCVLESVSKPKVTFKCDEKHQKVQFTCSVLQTQGVTYMWFDGDKHITNENANILVRTSNQVGTNSFICNVSNAVSSQISNGVKQDCLKTIADDENTLFGLDLWIMVAILAGGGGLVLVLIVATIICCTINRRRRRLQVKDEQELRLRWSTSNQQHHHPHSNPQPPQHSNGPTPTQGRHAAAAGHTGPRPHRSRQNRPRPPDPITGQPLPGPRRQAPAPKETFVNDEEVPPPLPQPRKKVPRTHRGQNA